MDKNLYVYDSTNKKYVRLTGSNDELNINNIEKNLKQYRREGKCYFSTINGTTSDYIEDLHILWNPSDSNYKVGLYNVSISISSSDTSQEISASFFRLVSLSNADLKSDAVYVNAKNAKLNEPNDADIKICKEKGTDGSVTENGVLDIIRPKPSDSSGGLFHKLDFQEEIIEIEPGNGVKFDSYKNNTNFIYNYSVSFRYIKILNSEEI